MKTITNFLRNTITGGVLFLLPIILIVWGLKRVHDIFVKITEPIAKKLPNIIFGLDGSGLIAIIILIVVCFLGGLLFRSNKVKKGVDKIEDNILAFIPGYTLMKSVVADLLGEELSNNLKTVFIEDGDSWKIGFLVEEGPEMSTVFFPEAPKHDAGEVKIIPTKYIRKVGIPVNQATKSLKSYGKGLLNKVPSE